MSRQYLGDLITIEQAYRDQASRNQSSSSQQRNARCDSRQSDRNRDDQLWSKSSHQSGVPAGQQSDYQSNNYHGVAAQMRTDHRFSSETLTMSQQTASFGVQAFNQKAPQMSHGKGEEDGRRRYL